MYQRYYKQKKFGRIFSVFLIIGSGMSHYLKEGKGFFKATFSLNNLNKYEDYIPENAKEFIEDLKENDIHNIDNIKNISENYLKGPEERIKFLNDCENYRKNLEFFKDECERVNLFSNFNFEEKKEFNKNELEFDNDSDNDNDNAINKKDNNNNDNKDLINFNEEDIINIYIYDKLRKYDKDLFDKI